MKNYKILVEKCKSEFGKEINKKIISSNNYFENKKELGE